MIKGVNAVYVRKPNGDLADERCDACDKIGAAYIELTTSVTEASIHLTLSSQHITLICKSCLAEWDKMINEVIMNDVLESVRRRGKD